MVAPMEDRKDQRSGLNHKGRNNTMSHNLSDFDRIVDMLQIRDPDGRAAHMKSINRIRKHLQSTPSPDVLKQVASVMNEAKQMISALDKANLCTGTVTRIKESLAALAPFVEGK